MSASIRRVATLRKPVFLLNSCLELDIAAHRALFLPKLQSYFAEFLKEGSPALLGILYLPTCVGLRYR